MFAVIYIPDFLLQAALRPEPELHARAVALIDPADSSPLILQLTQSAREAGMTEGMTPTQALARCSKAVIKARSPSREHSAGEALLHCAFSISPDVEATGEGIVTLDLKGFAELTVKTHEFGQKIFNRLLMLNLAAQVGVAENPLLALHAARCARPFLLVENSRAFLEELPIESIEPSAEVLAILKKWGIHNLGSFLALGKEALAVRLGPEAVQLFDRASANSTRPLRLEQVAETFQEQIEFENPVETAQPLLFILQRFLEQISLRLEMLCLVAEELNLRLIFSDAAHYEHVFKIPAPTIDIGPLLRMLQTHLETLKAEHPITGLMLTVKPCHPANQQFELFEAALRDPNRFYETLARLTALVGSDRVGTPILEPTHRPDAFRLQLLSLEPFRVPSSEFRMDQSSRSHANSRPATRNPELSGLCLRRFRPPVPTQIESRQGATVLLNRGKSRERILQMTGPWPRSGDWWDNQRWSRVEWDVQTETGNLYRLFQQDGGWFLEGVYD